MNGRCLVECVKIELQDYSTGRRNSSITRVYFARKSAILHAFYARVGAAIPVASTVCKKNGNEFCQILGIVQPKNH